MISLPVGYYVDLYHCNSGQSSGISVQYYGLFQIVGDEVACSAHPKFIHEYIQSNRGQGTVSL